jgi:NAD(P)H dehydrogenase (quinone)
MSGDKLSTLQYLFLLAMQHGGIWIGTATLPSNAKGAKRDDVNFLGAFAGPMMQSPSDASVDEVVAGDLETARLYGERIAKVTSHLQLSKED